MALQETQDLWREMWDYLLGILDGEVSLDYAQSMMRHLLSRFNIHDTQLEDVGEGGDDGGDDGEGGGGIGREWGSGSRDVSTNWMHFQSCVEMEEEEERHDRLVKFPQVER